MKLRRRARIAALQALYEIDLTGHPSRQVIERRTLDEQLPQRTNDFIARLVQGVLEHKTDLDELIQTHAPEWPIDQMAIIDRNILRIAIFEFGFDGGTPVKVAINEAVELAKLFGSNSAPRFVNGVLGSLVASDLPTLPCFDTHKQSLL